MSDTAWTWINDHNFQARNTMRFFNFVKDQLSIYITNTKEIRIYCRTDKPFSDDFDFIYKFPIKNHNNLSCNSFYQYDWEMGEVLQLLKFIIKSNIKDMKLEEAIALFLLEKGL
jgi:hypothetical protein